MKRRENVSNTSEYAHLFDNENGETDASEMQHKEQTEEMQDEQHSMKGKKYCKHCGQIIDEECVVCPKCGKQVELLKTENITINNNNTVNSPGFSKREPVFSDREHVVTEYETGVSQKSRMVALLLAIFLGEFGAHHFYAGKIGMGILYLLTFGLFSIGWIVDIILLATGKYKDDKGEYIIDWGID